MPSGAPGRPACAVRLRALLFAADDSAAVARWLPQAHAAPQRVLPERLMDELCAAWRQRVIFDWRKRHDETASARARLAALQRKASASDLTENERFEHAALTFQLEGAEPGLPLLEAVVRRNPQRADACFSYGAALLEQKDMRGVEFIEKAVELDPEWLMTGGLLVHYHLSGQGRTREAEDFISYAFNRAAAGAQATHERALLTAKDQLQPPALPVAQVDAIRSRLPKVPDLQAAWLVRKLLMNKTEAHHFLILHLRRNTSASLTGALRHHAELRGALELPPDVRLILLDQNQRSILRALQKVAGASLLNT
jgi:hypothetical protein